MESSVGEIVPFNFEGRQVRTLVDLDGEPWFVAADVCRVLGIGDVRRAVQRLDQRDRSQAPVVDTGGRVNTSTHIVNESGLYDLIIRSDKSEARPFRRWITSEVLPSIRKTGAYSVPSQREPVDQLDVLQSMLDQMRSVRDSAARAEITASQAREDVAAATAVVEGVADRVDALEGNHGWYSALAYAKRQRWATDVGSLNALGRRAGQIGRGAGLRAAKVPHPTYGEANAWPEWVWDQAYQDGAGE